MPYKVAAVDDDSSMLMVVRSVLSQSDISVVPLKSGKALLEYIDVQTPDLILLDLVMPEMSGFETHAALREKEHLLGKRETPVIFLTAKEDPDEETRGLELGAIDFIKKPFVPKILTLRVLHSIELDKLQNELESEVIKKTKEIEALLIGIVKSLAEAIDAKDTYTNGHSLRVAEYSREIAKRFGYSPAMQQKIYMMGLLHDVGKIGVPDAIINKDGKLDDEEYARIKEHPIKGAKILENIKEMPELVTGAKWHHERYDGKGYPDGLSGKSIPEEARIIAVADAYDAMSSNRSYRRSLPQEKVREQIVSGKGSQFDPDFADIMVKMIDEDKDYKMKEQKM